MNSKESSSSSLISGQGAFLSFSSFFVTASTEFFFENKPKMFNGAGDSFLAFYWPLDVAKFSLSLFNIIILSSFSSIKLVS